MACASRVTAPFFAREVMLFPSRRLFLASQAAARLWYLKDKTKQEYYIIPASLAD